MSPATPPPGLDQPPTSARVARRVAVVLALAVLAGVAAVVTLTLLQRDPDVVRLLLVAAVVGAVLAVLLATESTPPLWESRFDRPAVASGQDTRTSFYVRLLEDNRTSTTPDPAVRDRLRTLAEQTLVVRRGRSADGLGPRTRSVVDGRPRRLTVAEVDAVLDELEGL